MNLDRAPVSPPAAPSLPIQENDTDHEGSNTSIYGDVSTHPGQKRRVTLTPVASFSQPIPLRPAVEPKLGKTVATVNGERLLTNIFAANTARELHTIATMVSGEGNEDAAGADARFASQPNFTSPPAPISRGSEMDKSKIVTPKLESNPLAFAENQQTHVQSRQRKPRRKGPANKNGVKKSMGANLAKRILNLKWKENRHSTKMDALTSVLSKMEMPGTGDQAAAEETTEDDYWSQLTRNQRRKRTKKANKMQKQVEQAASQGIPYEEFMAQYHQQKKKAKNEARKKCRETSKKNYEKRAEKRRNGVFTQLESLKIEDRSTNGNADSDTQPCEVKEEPEE